MKKNHSIGLLEARMNRLERNKKANHNICRKIRREIRQMKREGAARSRGALNELNDSKQI